MVFIVSVDGTIGAGKSFFLEHLQDLADNRWKIMQEPIQKWQHNNLLGKFYESPERYTGLFQVYVMATLLTQLENHHSEDVIITERSLLASRHIFVESLNANQNFEIEYQTLKEIYEIFENLLSYYFKVDLIIYLKVSPETAYKRIIQRNRKEEQNITIEYLETINKLYDNWLLQNYQDKVIVIDNEKKLDHETIHNIINIIKKKI